MMIVPDMRPAQFPQGAFPAAPIGLLLHSSRSGRAPTTELPSARVYREYSGTVAWCQSPSNGGIGWHVTVGEMVDGSPIYAIHLPPDQWAYHVRELSSQYLGLEFSQPTVDEPISNAQVQAAAHWIVSRVFPRWPFLTLKTLLLPGHSETVPGKRDGKTDPYPAGDPHLDDLRRRLRSAIGSLQQPEPPASTPDALMEAVYHAHASTLGAKRFAGELRRDYYTGPVLVCDGGIVTPSGLLDSGRVTDDWTSLNEAAGTLSRY